VGLPIPGAAGILVSLVAANHAVDGQLAVKHVPVAAAMLCLSFFMVSTIKFRSFKDLRLNWRSAVLVLGALSTAVIIAVSLHVAVALGWLLISYVAIGLFETLIAISRRLRMLRRAESETRTERIVD
jgi:CDP-diacylglycerol--serine O-phosphatidyltransferase